MKVRVVIVVLLALSIPSLQAIRAVGQTSTPETAAVAARIDAEDSAVGKAITTRDYAALDRYWSPAMIVNGPTNRIVNREQVIESMHHGGLNYTSLKGTTEYFTVIDGVAIKMMHEEVVMADGPMAGKHVVRRSTNVLQRSGEDWVLIARQATYVGFDGAILGGTVTTAFTPSPATAETEAIRAQIDANGRAVGRAIATQDFEALQKLWAPEMVVNSPGNNILTREQVFGAMREDKLKYESAKTYQDAFRVFGDVAIEMGHEDIVMSNGPMAGQPLKRRFTNVWRKSGEGWMQIARQATYVGVDGGAVYGHRDASLGG
jgi:ketosteroid isomerase-like protein